MVRTDGLRIRAGVLCIKSQIGLGILGIVSLLAVALTGVFSHREVAVWMWLMGSPSCWMRSVSSLVSW
jgi:hypothetical protein